MPAGVGEDKAGQKRDKAEIDEALADADIDDVSVSAGRPESILGNAAPAGPALLAFSRFLSGQ